ncbi:hypothetical protein [Ignatzschineria sp. LJL83]
MRETILTRWETLSVTVKEIIRNKEILMHSENPKALEILSQLSQLAVENSEQKSLIVTYHISDAIFMHMLLQQANPELSLELILPHQTLPENLAFNADITIVPFSMFVLENNRQEADTCSIFSNIILDHNLPTQFLTELFKTSIFAPTLQEESETQVLTTSFQELSNKIAPKSELTALETIKPKGEKISLSKVTEEKPVKASKKITSTVSTKESPEVSLATAKEETKTDVTNISDTNDTITDKNDLTTVDPATFIAIVARNVQRQYIRDYIREHNLQHVLIVTHNRQSARLLEKYLYRARIRSRVVHEKIDDETATSLFDRYNEGQFTALILMHRVVEDLAEKIQKCDAVIFLDFPTVYSEYANRINFVQNNLKPPHFISIATDNDKAWVQSLVEEYPELDLPLVEIDIKPPKKRPTPKNSPKEQVQAETSPVVENTVSETQNSAEEHSSEQDSKNSHHKNRRNPRQARGRNERHERNDQRQDRHRNQRDQQPRQQRRRADHNNNQQDHEFGDSQSDFFSMNQDEIVNHNRLPFEAGSFEANIARENRRRGRDSFNTPGGIGQSTNGNFLQNITQGFNNNNGNSQQPNTNNNRRQNNRNQPRSKNNRKK